MKVDREKMLWRCRRGARELDSVLMPFAEDCYDELSTLDKSRFKALLDCQDTQLLDWILGREMPDQEGLQNLIAAIIRHSKISRGT